MQVVFLSINYTLLSIFHLSSTFLSLAVSIFLQLKYLSILHIFIYLQQSTQFRVSYHPSFSLRATLPSCDSSLYQLYTFIYFQQSTICSFFFLSVNYTLLSIYSTYHPPSFLWLALSSFSSSLYQLYTFFLTISNR